MRGATRRQRRGKPFRWCTGSLPPRQHRARPPDPRRATSDGVTAGDRSDDGERQGARCTPTTNARPSGQPDGGDAGDRDAGGPGGRGGGRRCDRRAGRGNPAAARRVGNLPTRRGPTDARLHRRSTSRSGQPDRRPTGRANAGPLDLIHRGAPHHVPVCQGERPSRASDTAQSPARRRCSPRVRPAPTLHARRDPPRTKPKAPPAAYPFDESPREPLALPSGHPDARCGDRHRSRGDWQAPRHVRLAVRRWGGATAGRATG